MWGKWGAGERGWCGVRGCGGLVRRCCAGRAGRGGREGGDVIAGIGWVYWWLCHGAVVRCSAAALRVRQEKKGT